MAGIRIELRRTTNKTLTDGLFLGESLIDTTDNSFGVEIGTAIPVWYPGLDPATGDMILHKDQKLTGKDANGNSYIYLDWDSTDILQISNAKTNTVMASFGVANQSITRASDDLINNGAPQSLESFDLNTNEGDADNIISLTPTSNNVELPGNFYLWVNKATPTFSTDFVKSKFLPVNAATAIRNTGGTPNHGAHLYSKFKGIGISKNTNERYPQGVGLRSWVNLPNASDLKLTFFALVYMSPTGGNFQTRIGYPNNFKVFETVMGPTDTYKVVAFQYDPAHTDAANKGKPLVIDWFYNPWWDFSTDGTTTLREMLFSCMSVVPGHWTPEQVTPAVFQEGERRVHSLTYATGKKKVTGIGSKTQYVNFARPLISDNYVVNITNATHTVTIGDKNKWGFAYKATAAPSNSSWSFEYSAHVVGDVSDV